MGRVAQMVLVLLTLAVVGSAGATAPCQCAKARTARCADPSAKYKIAVNIDLDVVDGTVEVVTQSGPYHVPVSDLDGKQVLFLFLPRGEVFQGFFEETVQGSLTIGVMHGATASIPTGAVFAPGEYELLLFIDAVPGGGIGPQRGDLASFDNSDCEPTGVSIRVPVACEDTSVTIKNRQVIIF